MQERSDAHARTKVWEMIGDIRMAVMTTRAADGALRARPMVAVEQDTFEGALWFFTTDGEPKVQEIQADPHVGISYADPKTQNYVSISGTAEIVRDRATIGQLWSEYLRTWFPKGKDDPSIALIKVTVNVAEYWDSPSSTLLHLYGYAKARATGEQPKAGENQTVRFNAA